MDLVARCASLPRPGETLTAIEYCEVFGGKGANQAVGAARSGGSVQMISRVGSDVFADKLIRNLDDNGIDCRAIARTHDCPSGLALILVDNRGENQIVVIPGANGQVSCTDIDRHIDLIAGSDCLLIQLEVPLATVIHAIKVAKQKGVRVIVDPAPVPAGEIPTELLQVDLLCPNEGEAIRLTGVADDSLESMKIAACDLFDRGASNVAITLGHRGTLLFDGRSTQIIESISIKAIDTTGAGDAFAGALAVRWSETNDLIESVRWANVAGALAASRHGAQTGIATREEIERKFQLIF
jgi:ribokinase